MLVDGDNVICDSFEIARYLERTFPKTPSLFGGPGGENGCLFVNAYSDAIIKREPLPRKILDCMFLDTLHCQDIPHVFTGQSNDSMQYVDRRI